jgi:ATP synthase protein I
MEGANQNDPGNVRASGLKTGLMIRRGLRFQSLAGLALAGILMVMVDSVAAYSSMFGSLAAFIPALIFAVIVAPKFGNDSTAFLRAAVIGEAVKLLLIALICTAVFLWVKPLAAGWFFTGMIVVIFTGFTGLFFSK